MGIVIFSGTTEGRRLSAYLSSKKVKHDVCVATESGELVMEPDEYAMVHVGRLDEDGIQNFLREKKSSAVIDATHPYAKIVTELLQTVCNRMGISYLRVNRECGQGKPDAECVHSYLTAEACAEALRAESGNVFLATGSKELECYMQYPELVDRIFVRVLPSIEALSLCKKAGICEKHIIAMYGPHTKEVNEALFRQYNIKHLVTKESGQTGGYQEKLEAAQATGVLLHVIERPENATGLSMRECIRQVNAICGIEGEFLPQMQMKMVGLGPGSQGHMTVSAKLALEEADYVFGAKRMLASYTGKGEQIPLYMPAEIIAKLEEIRLASSKECIKVVALFSGDTGLYSGATKLYRELKRWGKCSSIEILPGISSFSAFAAAIGVDYQNAHLESLHGKSSDEENLQKIKTLLAQKEKTFVLLSGKEDFSVLEGLLPKDFAEEIIIGMNLSYPEQKILYTSLDRMSEQLRDIPDGLFIVLIYAGC